MTFVIFVDGYLHFFAEGNLKPEMKSSWTLRPWPWSRGQLVNRHVPGNCLDTFILVCLVYYVDWISIMNVGWYMITPTTHLNRPKLVGLYLLTYLLTSRLAWRLWVVALTKSVNHFTVFLVPRNGNYSNNAFELRSVRSTPIQRWCLELVTQSGAATDKDLAFRPTAALHPETSRNHGVCLQPAYCYKW